MKKLFICILLLSFMPLFGQDFYKESQKIKKTGDNGKVIWKEKLISENSYRLILSCINETKHKFDVGTAKGVQDGKPWTTLDDPEGEQVHFDYTGFKPKETDFDKNTLEKVYKPKFSGKFVSKGGNTGGGPLVWSLVGEETAILANIDVDYSRDGKIIREDDNVKEEADDVTYPGEKGALVVVNVDDDEGDDKPDCLDSTYNKDNDLSEIILELGDNINSLHKKDEIKAFLVGKPVALKFEGEDAKPRFRIFDDKKKELLVLKKDKIEKEITEYFQDEKKRVFKIEGLQFARAIQLVFEIRKGDSILSSDEVKMRSTSYVVNHNKQKELKTVGSQRYAYLKNPGILSDGFCQDGAEYGFQATFINGKQQNMIIDLGIKEHSGGNNELKIKDNVGFYNEKNEDFEKDENNGDMGGNIECIPVGDNGTILAGNTMSKEFGFFLLRQGVQKLITVPIKEINLAHIDEIAYIQGDTIYQISYSKGKQIMDNYKTSKVTLLNDVLSDFSPDAGTAFFEHLENLTGIDFSSNFKDGKIDIHLTKEIDAKIKGTGMKVVYVPQLHYVLNNNPRIDQRSFSFPTGVANSAFRNGVTYVNSKSKNVHNGKFRQDFFKAWQNAIPGITFKAIQKAWLEGGEAHCASNGIHEPFNLK